MGGYEKYMRVGDIWRSCIWDGYRGIDLCAFKRALEQGLPARLCSLG